MLLYVLKNFNSTALLDIIIILLYYNQQVQYNIKVITDVIKVRSIGPFKLWTYDGI